MPISISRGDGYQGAAAVRERFGNGRGHRAVVVKDGFGSIVRDDGPLSGADFRALRPASGLRTLPNHYDRPKTHSRSKSKMRAKPVVARP